MMMDIKRGYGTSNFKNASKFNNINDSIRQIVPKIACAFKYETSTVNISVFMLNTLSSQLFGN